MKTAAIFALAMTCLIAPSARAESVRVKAAREAMELIMKKFGREAAEEGAERLAGRLAKAAARHGDDVLDAARKIGPKALKYADEAGDFAPQAMKLIGRHGEDAATFVLAKPRAMGLFRKYGDEAAEAMIRHRGAADDLIEMAGEPAVAALKGLSGQGGRRLAMLADAKDLARLDEVLGVVGKYGEKACSFVWENKGALAVSATMAAFLRNPEPFIDGTVKLGGDVVEDVAAPVVASASKSAGEAVGTTVTWVIPAAVLAGLVALACFGWTNRWRFAMKPPAKP